MMNILGGGRCDLQGLEETESVPVTETRYMLRVSCSVALFALLETVEVLPYVCTKSTLSHQAWAPFTTISSRTPNCAHARCRHNNCKKRISLFTPTSLTVPTPKSFFASVPSSRRPDLVPPRAVVPPRASVSSSSSPSPSLCYQHRSVVGCAVH